MALTFQPLFGPANSPATKTSKASIHYRFHSGISSTRVFKILGFVESRTAEKPLYSVLTTLEPRFSLPSSSVNYVRGTLSWIVLQPTNPATLARTCRKRRLPSRWQGKLHNSCNLGPLRNQWLTPSQQRILELETELAKMKSSSTNLSF